MQVQLVESQNSCSTESLRDDSYRFSLSLSLYPLLYSTNTTCSTPPFPPPLPVSHSHTNTERCQNTRAGGFTAFPRQQLSVQEIENVTLDLHCPPCFCSCWKFNDVLHYLTSSSASLLGCVLLLASVSLALRWDKNGYLLWDSPAVYLLFHYHCLSSPV